MRGYLRAGRGDTADTGHASPFPNGAQLHSDSNGSGKNDAERRA